MKIVIARPILRLFILLLPQVELIYFSRRMEAKTSGNLACNGERNKMPSAMIATSILVLFAQFNRCTRALLNPPAALKPG
jgi:hypothetical protein